MQFQRLAWAGPGTNRGNKLTLPNWVSVRVLTGGQCLLERASAGRPDFLAKFSTLNFWFQSHR